MEEFISVEGCEKFNSVGFEITVFEGFHGTFAGKVVLHGWALKSFYCTGGIGRVFIAGLGLEEFLLQGELGIGFTARVGLEEFLLQGWAWKSFYCSLQGWA